MSGELFADRYALGALIGQGGTGRVHIAEDTALGRTVAMKVLGPEHAQDERARERFREEAVLAASVQHPNVVPVLDAVADGDDVAIVMEHVDGPTLSQLLRHRSEPLPLDDALSLLSGIAAGLDAAHDAGLVHRDLKPANVLIDRGVPRLVDFGLARPLEGTTEHTTTIRGSTGYLAPEQARGQQATVRTDVYGFGCVAHHVLAGVPPFDGGSAAEVVAQHLHADPPDLRDIREDVPAAVAAAVLRALAKEPRDRPASAGAFAAELGCPPPLLTPSVDGDALTIADIGALTTAGSESSRSPAFLDVPARRRPRWLVAAGLTGVLVAGAVPLGLTLLGDRSVAASPNFGAPEAAARLHGAIIEAMEDDELAQSRGMGLLRVLADVEASLAGGTSPDASARLLLDDVADLVDDGRVEGETGAVLLRLSGELVSLTSTDDGTPGT